MQLGDGSTVNRYTPVGVYGLVSGIAMIALGAVRFSVIVFGPFDMGERCL